MQLENSFSVPLPVDEAWRVLLDLERIAPCMPGATLDSAGGDDVSGSIKVKLGPINLTYQGKASIVEKDEAAHRAVIEARGKDQRGNGTAAATITASLAADGPGTRVDVLTDLTITGRPAQFGRGVMTDVGDRLLSQFSDKLAAQLDAPAPAPAAAPAGPGPVAAAAATATGAVEEIAASVEQLPAESAPAKAVKKAAAATKKAAASATEKVAEPAKKAEPAKAAPAKKAEPAKKAAPAKAAPAKKAAAAKKAAPAAKKAAAPAARPSGPPTGPSGPPARPATGAPLRSVPSAAPRPVSPAPVTTPVKPEPIDLLEVSAVGPVARYAPAAGAAAAVVAVVLLVRRRRRRRG